MKDKSLITPISENELLRSINIVFDADHPERISHYFPTTKSIQLLKRLLMNEKSLSCFVVAPYGSGKSLLGSFYMHVIENKDQANKVLKPVLDRIKPIDKDIHKVIRSRIRKEATGIAIPLSGFVEDLPNAILKGIKESLIRTGQLEIHRAISQIEVKYSEDMIKLLSFLRDDHGGDKIDHIDIVWDEFGRHLEELVTRGDAQRLNELQLLSEFSSRSKKISMSLVLFLHQSLMRYAANVPRAITEEWKKVEARFETVQYVDDSKEITLLAARVLESLFPDQIPEEHIAEKIFSDSKQTGLFHDLTDMELSSLINAAYPVLPAALYTLPRISSRVAQNERTLFSFLFSITSTSTVTPVEIFDYFSDLMRADTTLGGTFHHWLETQNALSKSDTIVEERIIKTLSLLSMGFSGERNRVSKDTLATLSKNYISDNTIDSELESLIKRKLLLFRKNSSSVVLWHANDIDLRGKIESEKINIHYSFNLIDYINQYLPLEGWRPLEYNISKNMTRYYRGQCISLQDLKSFDSTDEIISQNPADGVIWYVIPETEDEINEATALITERFKDLRIVALIPRKSENLFDVAIEAFAIERLLEDSSLTAEDPLVGPELKLMLDDSQTYLMRIIDKLYMPSSQGPQVICNGRLIENIASKHSLRLLLSENMFALFPDTPLFNNELINKRQPSKIIVNARKKLILGILDRYGSDDLGLEGNRPDKSMLETLLIQPGLYSRQKEGHWAFAKTNQIKDKLVRGFWETLEKFFAAPSDTPKKFSDLYSELNAPPLGIREGLFPIFTAVGFRAFPSAITITGPNGEYIQDLKPSIIEDIYKKPDQFLITVVKLSEQQQEYLTELGTLFNDEPENIGLETDPVRKCFDALEAWKAQLPPAAVYSRKFSKPVLQFQKLIMRTKNPAQLFLQDFFHSYGISQEEWKKLIKAIKKWKKELEGIVEQYYLSASRTILSTLQMGNETSARNAGTAWVKILPRELQQSLKEDSTRAVIERFSFPYDDDHALIDSISSLLIGKRIDRWDDSTITLFDREFKNIIHRIEDDALNSPMSDGNEEKVAIDLLCARIDNLYKKLELIIGKDEASSQIKKMMQSSTSLE
jgi:hypothetical protein